MTHKEQNIETVAATPPKKRVYISGKITGLDIRVAEEFFAAAAVKVRQCGDIPLNPMEIFPENPNWKWHDYMIEDLRLFLMGSIQMVVLLPNWHESRGARIEKAVAEEMKIPVMSLEEYESLSKETD